MSQEEITFEQALSRVTELLNDANGRVIIGIVGKPGAGKSTLSSYLIENLPKGNTANNYGTYFGSMSNHDKVYANVVDVLTNGASINTNAFEALKTVEIIQKIYKSQERIA